MHVDPGTGNRTSIVSTPKPLQKQVVTGTGKLTSSGETYISDLLPYGAVDQGGEPKIWRKSRWLPLDTDLASWHSRRPRLGLILNAALEEADHLRRYVQGSRKQMEHTEMRSVAHLFFQIERVTIRRIQQAYFSANTQDRRLWKEWSKKIYGLCKIVRWRMATKGIGKHSILYKEKDK